MILDNAYATFFTYSGTTGGFDSDNNPIPDSFISGATTVKCSVKYDTGRNKTFIVGDTGAYSDSNIVCYIKMNALSNVPSPYTGFKQITITDINQLNPKEYKIFRIDPLSKIGGVKFILEEYK